MTQLKILKDKTTGAVLSYSILHDERSVLKTDANSNAEAIDRQISDENAQKLESGQYELELGAGNKITITKKDEGEDPREARRALKEKFKTGNVTQADRDKAIEMLL